MARFLLFIAVCALAFGLAGCGGGTIASITTLSTTPTSASVIPGGTVQFSIDQNVLVDWTAPDGGTVVAGLFTAPVSTGTYRVIATSFLNPLVSTTANVTVSSVGISVSPSIITVAKSSVSANAFTAVIVGSANKAVNWSLDQSAAGSITSGTADGNGNARGSYTAGTAPGLFTVRATSQADPSVSATAQVIVLGSSALGLSPRTVTLAPGASVTLTAVLTDGTGAVDSTTALTWTVTVNPVGATLTGSGLRQRTLTIPANFVGVATCQVRVATSTGQSSIATIQVVSP